MLRLIEFGDDGGKKGRRIVEIAQATDGLGKGWDLVLCWAQHVILGIGDIVCETLQGTRITGCNNSHEMIDTMVIDNAEK